MSTVVVVGDAQFSKQANRLLPTFEVLGAPELEGLAEPVTAFVAIRGLIEAGRAPEAIICTGTPGFTVLSQLPHFSPSRCLVCPTGSIWPPATLQWISESAGMTLVPTLEAIPVALLGHRVPGVAEGEAATGERPPTRTLTKQSQSRAHLDGQEDAPIQVPPPPVSLDPEPAPVDHGVIDAGPTPSAPKTAYLPTDLLRPLRPRRG